MHALYLLPALWAHAHAAPKPCATTTVYATRTANYDGIAGTAIPTPFKGLDYTGFQVGQGASSFITPATGAQWAIAYGIPGAVDVDKARFDSIGLRSLYYACDQGIPQPACDIHIVGTSAETAQGVSKTVVYPAQGPGPVGSYKMLQATFDAAWGDLKKVNFSAMISGTTENYNGGLVLDQVVYVGKKVKCVK